MGDAGYGADQWWQQILYANHHTGAPLLSSALQALLVVPLCWVAYNMVGPAGVLIAYIFIQSFPVCILGYEGFKRGLISSIRPAFAYGQMTLAATTIFLPLAWLEQSFNMTAFVSIAAAFVIGILSLGAGLFACKPVRQWSMQHLRRP